MTLRQLRYLVTLAECGSFSRAAEQLHMEQPPLSQAIRKLETQFGLRLFDRSRHGTQPTAAGSLLIERARGLLAMEAAFESFAHGLARGEKGRVRIGMAGGVTLLPFIPRAVRIFRERWPEVDVSLEESNTPALCAALHDDRVDIAIVRPPAPDPTVILRTLLDEPTMIVLPEGHPLAERGAVRLSDIRDEPFILFERHLGPGFYDTIISACQAAGFSPRLGQSAPQVVATIPMVAAGMGVSVLPAYLDQIQTDGATFHAIEGPRPRATTAIATTSRELPPAVAHFEATLREVCGVGPC